MMRNRDAYRAPKPAERVEVAKPLSPGWLLVGLFALALSGLGSVNMIRGGALLPCDALAGMVLRAEMARIMADRTLDRERRGAAALGAMIGARIGAAQHDPLSCQLAMLSARV